MENLKESHSDLTSTERLSCEMVYALTLTLNRELSEMPNGRNTSEVSEIYLLHQKYG